MAKALQPYVGFTIEENEVNFDSSKLFPIDIMLIDNSQDSAVLLEM